MPYVVRDKTHKISRVSSRPLTGADLLPFTHPEVVAFLKNNGKDPQEIELYLGELKRTDGDMARSIEDLVTVLLKKNIIKISDMSKTMQDKMALRAQLRMAIENIYNEASGEATF